MKIRTVGAELFHVDGRKDRQTDRQTGGYDDANSLLNFSNVTKNVLCSILYEIIFSTLHERIIQVLVSLNNFSQSK